VDLSDYMDRQYSVDRAMVKEIQLQTDRALETLVKTNLGQQGWPYALTNGDSLDAAPFSESTAAMILHAVAVEYGVIPDSVLVPRTLPGMARAGDGKKRKSKDIFKLLCEGTSALIDAISKTAAEAGGTFLTSSKTWGKDSPLTLTWVYELLEADDLKADGVLDKKKSGQVRTKIKDIAKDRIKSLIEDPASVGLQFNSDEGFSVPHPFVLLRSLQLAKVVGTERWSELQSGNLPSAFLNQLHTELSNSAIKDGGFDPACLVFALEGLLMLNPDAITDAVLQRVIDILSSATGVATHWQPVHPVVATCRCDRARLHPSSAKCRSCQFVPPNLQS
jgi:hypothetical protein